VALPFDEVAVESDPIADSVERSELRSLVRKLVEDLAPPERVQRLDEAERFDDELFGELAAAGLLAIDVPGATEASGNVLDQLVVIEELATGPTSMAAFLIAHFAAVQTIGRHARTDEHRQVVSQLVSGSAKASFALSEPAGGTDVARIMKTRAKRTPDGGFRVSGQKLWTSGATLASWIVVLARTSPVTDRHIDGITMFLVPADAPGVRIRSIDTLGIHGMSTCEIFFDDVDLPADSVLGDVDRGMRQVFATINRESLNAAAACVGVARGALRAAVEYVRQREVFGRPVGSFQVPQHWLVDSAIAIESARSLMLRAAAVELAGGRADVLAGMAKVVASEAAVDAALRGMQVMGGAGYTRELPMQRYFRDGRMWSFSPLNNEMMRNRLGETFLGLPRSY
jgi:alkylation response protein AidB-like acyl-CoA dehydrogenase